MRTTIAAPPRRLQWQAAFTTKTYKPQTSSLVVWQHVFVSDTPMTNWGGSSLLLTRVVKKYPPPENVVRAPDVRKNKPSRSIGRSRNSKRDSKEPSPAGSDVGGPAIGRRVPVCPSLLQRHGTRLCTSTPTRPLRSSMRRRYRCRLPQLAGRQGAASYSGL
jgi:hypothetical protein